MAGGFSADDLRSYAKNMCFILSGTELYVITHKSIALRSDDLAIWKMEEYESNERNSGNIERTNDDGSILPWWLPLGKIWSSIKLYSTEG